MAVNDSYAKSVSGLANGGELIVDGSDAETGAVNVTELGGTAGCEVYREVDTNGDGSWAASVNIAATSSNWHSQLNGLLASQSQSTRLRLSNSSGTTIDAYAVGYEVDD